MLSHNFDLPTTARPPTTPPTIAPTLDELPDFEESGVTVGLGVGLGVGEVEEGEEGEVEGVGDTVAVPL